MSTVILNGLDNRTNNDTVKNYCQKYGQILNCYIKSNQCTVTFADKKIAEEFIKSSPHRIDSNNYINATWKTTLNRNSAQNQPNLNSNCRLIIRGTKEQLEEKNLIQYFSRFGRIRMCLSNPSQDMSIITFDDRISYERALNESRHFLNGRSLSVEPDDSTGVNELTKRRKLSDTNPANVISQLEYEKEQLINERNLMESQYQERIKLYEYEKLQLNECLKNQHNEFSQQVLHYQCLLKQSLDELMNKDQQIEQLKRENKDLDELLRQSVHDNEQQQVHLKKREDVHNQTKRKYEELYRAYMKLKDSCSDIEKDLSNYSITNSTDKTTKPSIDNVRKKL